MCHALWERGNRIAAYDENPLSPPKGKTKSENNRSWIELRCSSVLLELVVTVSMFSGFSGRVGVQEI